MKCEPKEIRFTLRQSRYVEVVLNECNLSMPETLEECIELEKDLRDQPEQYINEGVWVTDQNDIQNLKWVDK